MVGGGGLTQALSDVIYRLWGGVRGGLAGATIAAPPIPAALGGVIGAGVVPRGIMAPPSMLARHYDPRIAMAFGVLGAVGSNEIEMDDRAPAGVSFPGFWELLERLAAAPPA